MVFKKGDKPWNFGLNKENDKRIKDYGISVSKTKKINGTSKGINNPMYGVHRFGPNSPHFGKLHSDETKNTISQIALRRFKDKLNHPSFGKSRPDLINRNKNNKGKTYEEIYRNKAELIKSKIGIAQEREKSHFWKGGIARLPYGYDFNSKLKKEILSRDDNSCRLCSKTNNLHIHHVDYDKNNNEQTNLIALCSSCHSKTNFHRRRWEDLISSILTYDEDQKW